ncbi:MAG: NfeD family protein [Oscillatoriaceae cyanobacterium Prado104]|nr:NfeD family protein [Oscillatoriaceae cyanobacterium Prado104]
MTVDNLQKAIVDEEIRPQGVGRVRFQNSWWPAKCEQDLTFKVGDTVHVVAIENITLIVIEA